MNRLTAFLINGRCGARRRSHGLSEPASNTLRITPMQLTLAASVCHRLPALQVFLDAVHDPLTFGERVEVAKSMDGKSQVRPKALHLLVDRFQIGAASVTEGRHVDVPACLRAVLDETVVPRNVVPRSRSDLRGACGAGRRQLIHGWSEFFVSGALRQLPQFAEAEAAAFRGLMNERITAHVETFRCQLLCDRVVDVIEAEWRRPARAARLR